MRSRRITIAVGAALISLGVLLALWPALRAGWRAVSTASAQDAAERGRLRILASMQGANEMRLAFERPNGAIGHLVLSRVDANSPWRPEPRVGAPGVLFGDGYPVFASPRFLAVHGFDSAQALRPVDESLAEEHADDVTVIQSWGGEIAIGLWRHGKVVRVALAGPIHERLLESAPNSPEGCERLGALMRSDARESPSTAACAAALAACPSLRDAALERLRQLCASGDPIACDILMARDGASADLWPEIDDTWRSIMDLLEARQARWKE